MNRVIDCMVDQKVEGICILANYSEQFLLSDDEREKLTKLCMKKIDGRVKTIVTVSHFATDIVRPKSRISKITWCRYYNDDASLSWCIVKG